ncbi:MAG: efflux RND transporter periplasmic adaptor subunit [Bacteroidia bacterium]|nr:efflux RND transporter periplasmic adaptor subunit [Bacteroidia bacterium]
MNWKKIVGIILGFAVVAVFVIKLKGNKKIAEQKVFQFDKEQAIYVEVDTLKMGKITANYMYTGTFEPNRETKISAEIQGKINEILVDVGSVVTKGQPLVQLDNSLLKLQLQSIEVQIGGLEVDVNRYSVLAKADAIQGVQLEKAELGLKSAKIQRATLLEQINKTTIKAPFSGIITAKLNEAGAFAAPGIPLLQLTDISDLKFTINVPENELNQFKLNNLYSLKADAYSEISLTGKAFVIGSKANMGSSFTIQFLLKNTSDLKIKSGMFGKVVLENDNQEQGIVIPVSAIVGSNNQPQVYLVKNGKSVLQSITILKKLQNQAVVSHGLNAGDVMVTNGFINLFEGANVLVK